MRFEVPTAGWET